MNSILFQSSFMTRDKILCFDTLEIFYRMNCRDRNKFANHIYKNNIELHLKIDNKYFKNYCIDILSNVNIYYLTFVYVSICNNVKVINVSYLHNVKHMCIYNMYNKYFGINLVKTLEYITLHYQLNISLQICKLNKYKKK